MLRARPIGLLGVLSLVLVVVHLILGGLFTDVAIGFAAGSSFWFLIADCIVFGVGALIMWLIARARTQLAPHRLGYWLSAGMALVGAVITFQVPA